MMFAKDCDTVNREKTERICQFPGCGIPFMGIGKTKYCDEHKRTKYRSELYGRKPGETAVFDNNGEWVPVNKINAHIKHSHVIATTIECTCALDGCGEPFRVMLLPNLYTYPLYCEKHRNEFQRNNFLKKQIELQRLQEE